MNKEGYTGVSGPADGEVINDVLVLVRVQQRPLVPVLRNALLAPVPREAEAGALGVGVVVALDGEELLEHLAVEVAIGLVGAVVGHHVDDEVVGGGRDEGGGEEAGEVVGVVLDGAFLVVDHVAAELVEGVAVAAVFLAELVGVAEASHVERFAVFEVNCL